MNIAGTRGMTRSGRAFAPKYTLKAVLSPIIPPLKDKFVSMTHTQQKGESTSSTSIHATTFVPTVPPVANDTARKSA